jgi:hypothetical protein
MPTMYIHATLKVITFNQPTLFTITVAAAVAVVIGIQK